MSERDNPHLHAVIMAGGTGSRFWPLSRRHLPKQFLAIGGDQRPLIRATYDRLLGLVPPERVFVVAGERYRRQSLEALPGLGAENFIGEPAGRNTAPCIGLAAHFVLRRDPEASLLVSPADHVIGPDEEFQRTVLFAARLLEGAPPGAPEPPSVTLGIPPREPATGYGYIEEGEVLQRAGGLIGCRVASFKEKPPFAVAQAYVESGRFLWNSGIFLWTARGVLSLIETHLPDLARGLRAMAERLGDDDEFRRALAAGFSALPSISIDHGVLERSRNVLAVRATFDWDDVGSWAAAARYMKSDGQGNRVHGHHVEVNTRNCVVFGSRRLVGTVGVEDLVIVETDDAVLVCRRGAVEQVKDLVERIERAGHGERL